ncbi:MAG: prepilin-type N-terminal cleavage/methylation domain-containing protein [Armatimonadetes bacterium]|nr:prepilin-type N-terminal cleavage/methylation domain-containing protein [Armatimonadota bacterium]
MKCFSVSRGHRAFTLVELLIVIIIIAVLAAVVIPRFADSGLRSKEAALKADLNLLRGAITRFHSDTGLYPKKALELSLIRSNPPPVGVDENGDTQAVDPADWKGPYLHDVGKDPVSGKKFLYSITPPTVGQVRSSATGTASGGTLYSNW